MTIYRIDTKHVIEKTGNIEQHFFRNEYGIDIQVVSIPETRTKNDWMVFYDHIKDADAIITAYLTVDEEFLAHMSHLKVISLLSTGYNKVDIQACENYKVKVCHIPEYCTNEVAEHAFALIYAINRNLKIYDSDVQKGRWNYSIVPAMYPLKGQCIVIFGFGKIGRRVAQIANMMGMRVGVVSKHLTKVDAVRLNVEVFCIEDVYREADIISNHMMLSSETRLYFNHNFFYKLIKAPIFINVGRGGSVDEAALADALDVGQIRGAGIDVLSSEVPELKKHPLLGRNNVILTPHAAFYSTPSMLKMCQCACDNLINAMNGNLEKVDAFVVPKYPIF